MSCFTDLTHRPIKKPRNSYGPDVYPQEPKQKEDELTPTNVKMGFQNPSQISEEFGTARNNNWNKEKMASFFNAILHQKNENNQFQDQGKRKLQVNTRDNFWLVVNKPRHVLESWFKDLSGNKSLTQLAKKLPIFNKKEEIFLMLCEHNISMLRAAWFIKMTNAYNTAIAEARARGRKMFDPFNDWSQALCKFLREQLTKILEHYQGSSSAPPQTSFLTAGPTNIIDIDAAMKNWGYCTQLAKHLYEEGLLDRQDFIQWLLDLVEKEKIKDDTVLKLVIGQVLRYLPEFAQSQLLTRRMAHFCAKKIQHLCSDVSCSPILPEANSPLSMLFSEYNSCPQHRGLLLSLSAIIQTLVIQCPAAFVWHSLGEGKHTSPLYGSPLDLLPCAPSSLPLGPGNDNPAIRRQIAAVEQQIRLRSIASEIHWAADKSTQSSRELKTSLQIYSRSVRGDYGGMGCEILADSTLTIPEHKTLYWRSKGHIINKVLYVLEILDRHNFDRVESSSTMDSLYNRLFSILHTKQNEPSIGEEPIINLLCEWAVSTQRSGEHRAIVVAKILEKRQNEITTEKYGDGEGDDKNSDLGSDTPTGSLPFQPLLMNFLDSKAPVLEEGSASMENKQAFANLILLFCELIRHEVFSHDVYMCTLISRGDLSNIPLAATPLQPANFMEVDSVKSDPNVREEMKMELLNQNLDSEFDIFAFKPSPKHSPVGSVCSVVDQGPMSAPGHPHTPARTPGNPHTPSMARTPGGGAPHTPGQAHTPAAPSTPRIVPPAPPPVPEHNLKRALKHLCYVRHFPILMLAPQDEYGAHETNQRLLVLYGVGKHRDEMKHQLRKISKELLKLYSRKNCLDATIGEVRKKEKKSKDLITGVTIATSDTSTASFDSSYAKFHKLSYFDMHSVTQTCSSQVLELVSTYAAGNSLYLPLIENISFLLYLMETALNIGGLLDFTVAFLKELPEVENQLSSKASSLANSYTTNLCLHFVAVLRKYQAYLFVNHDITLTAFDSLRKIVWRVSNPSDCTSAERCILAYLYDVFTSCHYVKNKMSDHFGPTFTKLKQTMYTRLMPSASNLRWEPGFLAELINNPRSKITQSVVKQLMEPANRYSFVCNAVLMVCQCQKEDNAKLNDVSVLCAELTARCNALSSEWLGVLKALCCSESQNACGYYDILTQIDVEDRSIHDSLAVFTSILISRHCFSLADLVHNVALHSLVAACLPTGGGGDPEAETGAHLTCHLLLRLLRTKGGDQGSMTVRSTCDAHLLESAHDNLLVGAVVAVLKAMLMLADSSNSLPKDSSPPPKKDSTDIIQSMLQSLDDDLVLDNMLGTSNKQTSGLSDYAKLALKQICTQHWVREKFLKDPESLFTSDLLLDNMLTHKQVQQLVQMICYPNGVPPLPPVASMPPCDDDDEDEEALQKRNISRILLNMDQWSVRVAWLELMLMFKLAESREEEQLLADTAACTINVFVQQTKRQAAATAVTATEHKTSWVESETDSIWLIAPLIGKLSSKVQGRVLKSAGQKLETGNNFWTAKNAKEKEKYLQKSISLLGNQPFLSLIRTCLKGHDEQREGLLKSLSEQLDKFVSNTKEPQDRGIPTDEKLKDMMQDSLRLRLSLVGSMFDTIQRSTVFIQDWSLLLSQLMSHGVVEIATNAATFILVFDMLSTLIYGALVTSENSEKNDDKRLYQALIRKLKREIGEKKNESMDIARQLLPLPKKYHEIVTNDQFKGKNIGIMDPKKGGYQLAITKQKVSPWDILEGHKNPAPLTLSWFGAVKLEGKVLRYEEQFKLTLYHSHNLVKPSSHYLEAPPLPPEDLEPPPEPKKEEPCMETKVLPPPDTDGKKAKRNKRRARMATPTHPQNFSGGGPINVPNPGTMYNRDMYGAPAPPPNWNNPYPQQPYNPGQVLPPGGPARYGQPPPSTAAKAQLRTFLNRPAYNPMPPSMPNMAMVQRQQLRSRIAMNQYRQQPGNFSGAVMGPPPTMGSGGMVPELDFGGSGPGGHMAAMGGGGMAEEPGFGASGSGDYTAGAMGSSMEGFSGGQPAAPGYGQSMGGSGGYMQQPPQQQTTGQFPPNSMYNISGGGGAGGANMGMGGAPPGMAGSYGGGQMSVSGAGPSAGAAGYNQTMTQQQQQARLQQMRQQQQQQQMIAMQQQQQQQQQQPQQMFGQMQRQLSGQQPPSYYGSQY